MTKQRELKALVRERMVKTGERYTAARAHLLTATRLPAAPADAFPGVGVGVLNGYDRFGGIQGDTGALCNVLRHAGITSPQTGDPYTETMINGLCGGPGFLYAVFEYKGWPPLMSLALRSRSMNDMYISDGLPRLDARVKISETTSAALARKALDSALFAGGAPLCVADVASLPWYGLPSEFVGGAPQVIAVAGKDDDAVWVDDRSTRPIRMDLDQLAKARASYRHASEIADRRFGLADTHGDGISKESKELWQKRHTLAADCRLSKAGAQALYTNLADIAGRILEAERAAVALMS